MVVCYIMAFLFAVLMVKAIEVNLALVITFGVMSVSSLFIGYLHYKARMDNLKEAAMFQMEQELNYKKEKEEHEFEEIISSLQK